jgi:hypothetical protein
MHQLVFVPKQVWKKSCYRQQQVRLTYQEMKISRLRLYLAMLE